MSRIECKICGAMIHAVQVHLKKEHPEVTLDMYKGDYPDAPLLSEMAKERIEAHKKAKEEEKKLVEESGVIKRPLNEVFGLGKSAAALSATGKEIPISTFDAKSNVHSELIPDFSDKYVFDIVTLKNVILGLELNMPVYAWGHAGTGKTELFEQIAGRTGRPMIRIQHTANTEESHIVGMWTVKNGETVWEPGPLSLAMKYGWLYLADEYDFAMPSVSAVYQPILEGKPLVIKEADAENRIVRPHPNFRFAGTGNTNGSGDEFAVYNGVVIQNSANFDRFGVVVHQQYLSKKLESQILQNQAGLRKEDADKVVEFGTLVREAFDSQKIGSTVSPRTLINGSMLGIRRGSFRAGLALSFINKLSTIDREVVNAIAQRVFGGTE